MPSESPEAPAFAIEGHPSTDQKERLEDWLAQLKIICRSYGVLLHTEDGDTRLIDLESGNVIGFGLTYLTVRRAEETRITGYDVTDSILDGTWPVEGPSGVVDQRALGTVWPTRASPPHHPSQAQAPGNPR